MQAYQQDFIEFLLACDALRFGEFVLKSGRKSPFFYNAGLFNTSLKIQRLGQAYAQLIHEQFVFGEDYEVLFGPAYKGIPLVIATSIALANQYQLDVPYAFNRKEVKDHGEGGAVIGTPLSGKILLIDDVMTAGTAVRACAELIQSHQASLAGVVLSLDRQEIGQSRRSAAMEIEQQYQIPVKSIVNFELLVNYLETANPAQYAKWLPDMRAYFQQYGVA